VLALGARKVVGPAVAGDEGLGDEVRGDRRRQEQEQRDQELVEREAALDQQEVEHRGHQHAADAQRRRLGRRVQALHGVLQLDQSPGAHETEDPADHEAEADQEFGEERHGDLTR